MASTTRGLFYKLEVRLTPTLTPTGEKRPDTVRVYCSEWDSEIRRIRQNGNKMCVIDVQTHLCNQQVGGSNPSTSSILPQHSILNMGEFPSGQRGQTVNLLSMTSVVRIHLPPPKRLIFSEYQAFLQLFLLFCFCKKSAFLSIYAAGFPLKMSVLF